MEALESCQSGCRATEVEWSDFPSGMLKPVPGTSDELRMRGFRPQWRVNTQWLPHADVPDGEPLEADAALATGA